jgi:hypothetical protein
VLLHDLLAQTLAIPAARHDVSRATEEQLALRPMLCASLFEWLDALDGYDLVTRLAPVPHRRAGRAGHDR